MRISLALKGIGAAAAVACVLGLAACGEPTAQAGDCVKLKPSSGGTDIEQADCPIERDDFARDVYVVDEVKDLDASCSGPTSLGAGIELKHEPDDVRYCLSRAYPEQ